MKSIAVDEYLATLDPDRKAALETIRSLIYKTIPGGVETMKYRMPAYPLEDIVCAMAHRACFSWLTCRL